MEMRKIYFSEDRAWVGDCQQDATHQADIPDATDTRWIRGKPSVVNTSVLTLSPFYPNQRLDVCVEKKTSNPLCYYVNHPPFEGVVAWMGLDELRDIATPVQNKKSNLRMHP